MWYVVQIVGGQEHTVINQIEKLADETTFRSCFVPEYEIKKRYSGVWKYVHEVLFPGYVFVDTKTPDKFRKELHKVSRMTKMLHDGNEQFIPLADDEKTLISSLIGDDDHVMKMSEGIIEGDEIIILKGPLMNHTGLVKKIDRHKRLAYLEIWMCGRRTSIKAGLEIIKKHQKLPTYAEQLNSEVEDIGAVLIEAAEEASTEHEKAAVMTGLADTPQLTETGIAPEVLSKLLPDEKIVVLPRVSHVSGGIAYRAVKRTFDVVSCGLALIICAVPMAVIAIKIKQESEGPVFYAQRRVGKDGKIFKLYKFRSMYTDAEARGAQWAAEKDPRVTPLGRKLRKTRLDEIPQFWNVIKGDMSLIGPRPERPAFHEEFCKRIDGWDQRLLVKPGISGLAQVTGGYELLPKEKATFDIRYIEKRGVRMDLTIVWKTIKTVLTGDGAR